MIQCISCLYTITYQQPKGKGLCCVNENVIGLLDKRDCKSWKLASMDMVRSRTVRKIVFDDNCIARLE